MAPRSSHSPTAAALHACTIAHTDVTDLPNRRQRTEHSFNPAAVQQQIQGLADVLLTLPIVSAYATDDGVGPWAARPPRSP